MNLGTFKTTGVIQCRDLISLMLHINNAKNNLKRVEWKWNLVNEPVIPLKIWRKFWAFPHSRFTLISWKLDQASILFSSKLQDYRPSGLNE